MFASDACLRGVEGTLLGSAETMSIRGEIAQKRVSRDVAQHGR